MLRIGALHGRLLSASALASVLSVATVVANAGALPGSGHYVAGKGEIGKAGQSLTVKQSSTTGIISWKSFSIGSKNSVTFNNGSGATLNRVTGGVLSKIAGSLHATGSLYLINAQGVIVSGTGRVVTGGSFVASSGDVSDSNIENGRKLRFRNANSEVINHGSIVSGEHASLTGSRVASTGTIDAASVTLRAEAGGAIAGGTIHAGGSVSRDGRILVIARSGRTKITGDLVARSWDGSGGAVETSGRAVAIGGTIDAGKGGSWLIDPENLTVTSSSASTIDNSLNAGTNVKLQTTASGTSGPGTPSSGAGDIFISAPLSWSTTATLTLDAYHSVQVDGSVSATGKGKIKLVTNDGGAGGDLSFDDGDITFANLSSVLTINGARYTLVKNIASLASDIKANSSGDYALANDYNAHADGTYKADPIATTFRGTFEGLGHTISNLTINISKNQQNVGLFAAEAAAGTIENIRLKRASVQSSNASVVGALVALARGKIRNDFASGAVAATTSGSSAGGLVGDLEGGIVIGSDASDTVSGRANSGGLIGETDNGRITASYASGSASGGSGANVGGLVGIMVSSSIGSSHASGNESASGSGAWVGGLVGEMDGTSSITQSYATGDSSGTGTMAGYGGLVGYMGVGSHDKIAKSYATGSVNAGGNNSGLGGLVGYIDVNGNNSITDSYATGAVTGTDNTNDGGLVGYIYNGGVNQIANTYATGAIAGGSRANVGGLVGYNLGAIKSSYATGAVTGGMSAYVGGLVGWNYASGSSVGTIATSYSTGEVSGSGIIAGGLVGFDTTETGSIVDSYWDTTTSGIASLSEGAGNVSNDSGISGMTTTQLQSGLPVGFQSSVWAENATINGGLPYLKALASSY